MGVGHHQAKRAFVGHPTVDLSDDTAFEHHQNPVGKRHDLVQFNRNQQDRTAGVAVLA